MFEKSLEQSRLEFLWQTQMIDTRTTMKGKYKHFSCLHCREGINEGVLESPHHLIQCEAYREMMKGMDPERNLQDRARYLQMVIVRRKEIESQLIKDK